MTDTVQDGTLRTRRSLLTAAAGGAAALAVGAIRPGGVAAGVVEPVNQDMDNATVAPTGVTNSTDDSNALYGTASTGIGVRGRSITTSDPANNPNNAGVVGIAGDDTAIAASLALTGVYGYSDSTPDPEVGVGSGVWGDSPDIGVLGLGSIGVVGDGGFGVLGSTSVTDGVGVWAEATDNSALALAVSGRAAFARSGRATVNSGNAKKVVNMSGVTASSLVLAVLAQNRSGRYVRAVVAESGKFTIYLNQSVSKDTKVNWIVFTNPSNLSG